jgi:hypothetical protein
MMASQQGRVSRTWGVQRFSDASRSFCSLLARTGRRLERVFSALNQKGAPRLRRAAARESSPKVRPARSPIIIPRRWVGIRGRRVNQTLQSLAISNRSAFSRRQKNLVGPVCQCVRTRDQSRAHLSVRRKPHEELCGIQMQRESNRDGENNRPDGYLRHKSLRAP